MSEIKPALSPEEWAAGSPRLDWRVDWEMGVIARCRDEGDRHALAALALHGQPFGFTWDDVDDLRGASTGMLDWRNDLADRIAALLPPREET